MTFEEKFQTRKIKANFHARMDSSNYLSQEVSVWFNEKDDGDFEFLFGPREPIIVLIRRARTESYHYHYDLEVERVSQLSELEHLMELAQTWSQEQKYVDYIVKTVSWDFEEVYFE